MEKKKVIIKRWDEPYGHVTNISDSLENLQKTVGGHIEVAAWLGEDVILVNEEGKLQYKLPNMPIGGGGRMDMLVGDLIVIGAVGDEFGDVHLTFQEWKRFVDESWKEWNG